MGSANRLLLNTKGKGTTTKDRSKPFLLLSTVGESTIRAALMRMPLASTSFDALHLTMSQRISDGRTSDLVESGFSLGAVSFMRSLWLRPHCATSPCDTLCRMVFSQSVSGGSGEGKSLLASAVRSFSRYGTQADVSGSDTSAHAP